MDSSSAEHQPRDLDGVYDQTIVQPAGSANIEHYRTTKILKRIRLLAWIQTQIKLFNSYLLIMAVKYYSHIRFIDKSIRASLPPIVFLAMYRSETVAHEIGSLGYLVAIVASLSFAMQPRAKFLQNIFRNILFACVATSFAILGLWCARQAKIHTQPPTTNAPYNSSAAAISAIFLFFNVYIANACRAVTLSSILN